ncbi:TLDc domain-containing protein [Entamoeba marina]
MSITILNLKIQSMGQRITSQQNQKQQRIECQQITTLKQWSGLNNYKIIFNSDIDGDGKNTIMQTVIGKSNLYFLSFALNDNIFGGYISTLIYDTCWIQDPNAFIFSLIRNGQVSNKRLDIRKDLTQYSFRVFSGDRRFSSLYVFGIDIVSCKIGCNRSYYNQSYYNQSYYQQNKDKDELIDVTYPHRFQIMKTVILQMY